VQSTDREEFETQLARLCAGFNIPVTKHRRDAYWSGLAKMSLSQLSRVIDLALGEDGPEDLPTTRTIWKMHRQMRAPGPTAVQTPARNDEPDHLEYFANRLLWLHLSHRGGLGSVKGEMLEELQRCLKFKRQIVDEFAGFIREGDQDATPAAFYQWWLSGLRQVSTVEKRTIDALNAASEHPDALKPFAPGMARSLGEHQMESA
jgi:hypothetical protein